jgi:predicted porin
MKKSLLAVAAMTAFAGAAQAQSSVTVYGILDVGYQGSNATVKTGAAPSAVTKSTYSGIGQGAESTNRLGFKGSEDLGGGSSAFFTIEYTLYPQEQDVSGTSQGGLKNRQTFVGYKKNGIGQAAVGTQYTPVHVAVSKTDAGGQNNMTGDLIYTGQGDATSVQGGTSGGNTGAYQTRYSNSMTFDTEVMGGFQGHLMAVLNNTNSTITAQNANGTTNAGGKVNTTGMVVGADYTWNKLFVTANYSQMKQITDTTNCSPDVVNSATGFTNTAANACSFAQFGQSTATGIPFATATSSTTYNNSLAGNPSNVVDTTQYYAGTYDFGILKAYAQFLNRKAAAASNPANYISRSASQIGVRGYITPTVESWASAGVGKYTPYGSTQPSANMSAWQVGSNYWLSKRTNLYAIYGQYAQSQSNYSATLGGATTRASAVNANSYAVGVRHTF